MDERLVLASGVAEDIRFKPSADFLESSDHFAIVSTPARETLESIPGIEIDFFPIPSVSGYFVALPRKGIGPEPGGTIFHTSSWCGTCHRPETATYLTHRWDDILSGEFLTPALPGLDGLVLQGLWSETGEGLVSSHWIGSVTAVESLKSAKLKGCTLTPMSAFTGKKPENKPPEGVQPLVGDRFGVSSLAFSPDGRTLACGGISHDMSGADLILWDLSASPQPSKTIVNVAADHLFRVAMAPDGRSLFCRSFRSRLRDRRYLFMWDLLESRPLWNLGGDVLAGALAYSPDGTMVAANIEGNRVRLWDAKDGTPIATFSGLGRFVESIAFSPSGHLLAAIGDSGALVWDLKTFHHQTTLKPLSEDDIMYAIGFTPDGSSLVIGGSGSRGRGQIQIRNVETGERVRSWKAHKKQVGSIAVSPDGRLIASRGENDGTLSVWALATGEEIRKLKSPNEITDLAFSPDGKILAYADLNANLLTL